MCFEKVSRMPLYIEKNKGFERLPDDVRFVPNLNINAKNLSFIGFWNPRCVCRSMPTYACIRPAYAGLGFVWPFIFKK